MAKLKAQYDAWFNDVTGGRDYTVPARIFLGAPQENPVLLTRQDWRGSDASWGPKGVGYWEVNVVARAPLRHQAAVRPAENGRRSDVVLRRRFRAASRQGRRKPECVFSSVRLPFGPGRLEASLAKGPAVLGVKYVEVKRID